MKKTVNFLAAYGSLRDGVATPAPPADIVAGLTKVDTIYVHGDLYVVRGENYPGFVPRVNGPRVAADLYLIRGADTLRALDAWEEVSDAPTAPYRRQAMTVYHQGRSVTFWVYVGNHPSDRRHPITATCWRDYFAAHFAATPST